MTYASMNCSAVPFIYPIKCERRHGRLDNPFPRDGSNYQRFRQHLRDEFEFTCVYCLWRETWCMGDTAFEIDHFLPSKPNQKISKEERRSRQKYSNLFYACRRCNRLKSNSIPKFLVDKNPNQMPLGTVLRVLRTGYIEAIDFSPEGEAYIELFQLNDSLLTERRRHVIERFQHLLSLLPTDEKASTQLKEAFGFPDLLFTQAMKKQLNGPGVTNPLVNKTDRPFWTLGPQHSK